MNILTTNLSHTAQRFAPAKMLVMIGVHGGITLVLRADLHTLTARHIPVHGKTRACMALASTDSWAGGLPHAREAGLRIMTATVFGVGPGAGPTLAGFNLKEVTASWDGGGRACTGANLIGNWPCRRPVSSSVREPAGPGISCQRQLRRRGRQGEGAVARLRASSYFVIDVSRELTAGRQSPLMSGRAGGNMGGDASWRRSARGDAAKGRR
jgi:hypothetical protein